MLTTLGQFQVKKSHGGNVPFQSAQEDIQHGQQAAGGEWGRALEQTGQFRG